MGSFVLTDEMQKLVVDNMKLVPFVLNRYYGAEFAANDDIMQIGYEGLCKAAYLYKKSLGYKFTTFAVRWIKITVSRWYRDTYKLGTSDPAGMVSLNEKAFIWDDDDVELIQTIPAPDSDTERDALNHIYYENISELCPILKRKEESELTLRDMAKQEGVSHQRMAYRIENEIRKARVKLGIRPGRDVPA